MGLQDAFDVLSEVVEQFDARGRSVRDVEATTDPDRAGALEVSMAVPVSLCAASSEGVDSSLTPQRASLSENGGLTVTVAAADLLPDLSTTEAVAGVDERAVHVDDGGLVMTVRFRVDPSSTAGTTPTDGAPTATDRARDTTGVQADGGGADSLSARLAAARSDDVPAYDDTEYLRTLYEACGTFTEMSERIEMDVAAETVRRYMIEADIHDPTSYDTAPGESDDAETGAEASDPGVDDPETTAEAAGQDPPSPRDDAGPEPSPVADEQFVADGLGLPDGVTVEAIVDAVVDATAVYEVERSLDLDRARTRDLLRQLNLLDLVLHRIDGPQQDATKTDVVERIRQCATGDTC